MSTSASSWNCWYMLGSFFRSFGFRREAMSRKAPPWGLPRPSRTSCAMARATTSASGARAAVARPLSDPRSLGDPAVGFLLGVREVLAEHLGDVAEHEALALRVADTPPSPRTPSSRVMPRTLSGHTMPVDGTGRTPAVRSAPAVRERVAVARVLQRVAVDLVGPTMPPVASHTAFARRRRSARFPGDRRVRPDAIAYSRGARASSPCRRRRSAAAPPVLHVRSSRGGPVADVRRRGY